MTWSTKKHRVLEDVEMPRYHLYNKIKEMQKVHSHTTLRVVVLKTYGKTIIIHYMALHFNT